MFFSFCLTFFLVRCAPGDPIKALAGSDNPSMETIQHLTQKYGLDQPVVTQLFTYAGQILQGDFGYSYLSDRPVAELIGEKVVPTLLLTVTALIMAVTVGTILGLYAAQNTEKKLSKLLCSCSYLFDSIPSFWLGLVLILVFASHLKLLPTTGMYDVRESYEGVLYGVDVARHMILPVMTLVLVQAPLYFRIARVSAARMMEEEFVTVLRAAGVPKRKILVRYVWRNALLPTVTALSSDLAYAITGVALVESVFFWPGMGRLLMDSIIRRDYPVISGIYLLLSAFICIVMLLTDLVYAVLDPRIRLE